ncbi:MAG: hypothetical protein APR54_05725 [Candidatus Cloacimonas sp. SDB]|nr:MAG: hypothetical protein APR54_05725 [Candidatus Cloacimonas sp. SDB]
MSKIICTIGPASQSVPVLLKMAAAGMDTARLNFSHGSHSQHELYLNNIREVNSRYGYNVKILQDLEGFRIRLGKFPNVINLQKGSIIELFQAQESVLQSEKEIPLDFWGNFKSINIGNNIFIDDGNILLQVLFSQKDRISAEVIIPGTISSNKGVNIPDLEIEIDELTEKDKADLNFGVEQQVDLIAQSFVRKKSDLIQIRDFLEISNNRTDLIAKIENRDGIDKLEEIMANSEGIMIARGDLGVSIPIYEVPLIQKQIIHNCVRDKKISITATQMLESMRYNYRPTRAEVSDVANAVLDGSQYVMLSAETAVGKYPVETVKMMKQIIDHTLKFR